MSVEAIIFDASDVLYHRTETDEKMMRRVNDLSVKYKIGMITNLYEPDLYSHFTPEQLAVFEYIHTFGKEGLSKPDPKVFEHTANQLGVLASSCIYVDDNFSHLRGAEDAGMQTILFENFEDFDAQLEQMLAPEE